jgi:hypothetical protein
LGGCSCVIAVTSKTHQVNEPACETGVVRSPPLARTGVLLLWRCHDTRSSRHWEPQPMPGQTSVENKHDIRRGERRGRNKKNVREDKNLLGHRTKETPRCWRKSKGRKGSKQHRLVVLAGRQAGGAGRQARPVFPSCNEMWRRLRQAPLCIALERASKRPCPLPLLYD